jgi:iron complex transport system substrate-binding protein
LNKKLIAILAIIAIAVTSSGVFIYVYYEGQAEASEIESLQNLVDDTGYVTSLTAIPNRIVSLAPSTTEILFALDLDDKVVGVTDYCNYPYDFSAWVEAGNMTSVGDFSDPSMEVVTSLAPDLILATGGVQAETVATMRNLGLKVLVLDPPSVDGVLADIELVGNATGKRGYAVSLVNSLKSRIDAVAEKVASSTSKPKVYYEVWYDPTSLWSAGSKSFQNELIEKAGGENIFADTEWDYFQSNTEVVIEKNPDVILLPSSGMGFGEPFWGSLDAVKARPVWNTISAVQNNKIFQVDGDAIARAGPRVVDSIEQLAEFFHPELF